jgi:hypothetical protein
LLFAAISLERVQKSVKRLSGKIARQNKR